jgi:hypothetical protein
MITSPINPVKALLAAGEFAPDVAYPKFPIVSRVEECDPVESGLNVLATPFRRVVKVEPITIE